MSNRRRPRKPFSHKSRRARRHPPDLRLKRGKIIRPKGHIKAKVVEAIRVGSELEYLVLTELKKYKDKPILLEDLEDRLNKRVQRMGKEINKRTLSVQLAILEQLGKVKNVSNVNRNVSKPSYLITDKGLKELGPSS